MAEPTSVQPAGLGALQLSPKGIFFRRTAHGGHVGWSKTRDLATITKNKLRPIGLWLQCRMLWICGISDSYFTNTNAPADISNENGNDDYDIHDD
jgi:hypothetical protein